MRGAGHAPRALNPKPPRPPTPAPPRAGYGPRKILRKGDYYNLAELLGKRHMDYVSPMNSTVLRTPAGDLVDWNHVNFVGEVRVDLKVRVPPRTLET